MIAKSNLNLFIMTLAYIAGLALAAMPGTFAYFVLNADLLAFICIIFSLIGFVVGRVTSIFLKYPSDDVLRVRMIVLAVQLGVLYKSGLLMEGFGLALLPFVCEYAFIGAFKLKRLKYRRDLMVMKTNWRNIFKNRSDDDLAYVKIRGNLW